MIGIGIVGAGYWGPNHMRVFTEIPGSKVAMVADMSEPRLAGVRERYPEAATTTDFDEMLRSSAVDAVVIATPVSTHAPLARKALLAGKHVLVEKPIAASIAEAEDLVEIADESGLVLMVGHTFLYSPAVLMLREMVASGELGEIQYIHSQRLNLGLFQRDINVLWDLAPHDISILMYVLGADPVAVAAQGQVHVRPGIEDIAIMNLEFPNDVSATVHVSWLDPTKVRRTTLVGTKKMVVYDDVEAVEKLRVYDKGVDIPPLTERFGEFQLSYRNRGVSIPVIPGNEPLRLEDEHFLQCIETGGKPRSYAQQGLRVVQTLETACNSIRQGGARLVLPTAEQRLLVGTAPELVHPMVNGVH